MKIYLISFLVILFYSRLFAINFRRCAFIPHGAPMQEVVCFDSDHDNHMNIIFVTLFSTSRYQVDFWEYSQVDQYFLDDSLPNRGVPSDVGYLDNDSLTDMIISNSDSIWVSESPNLNSHPTRVVWRWGRLRDCLFAAICDLDRDSKREIVASFGCCSLIVFENTGDNQYTKVWGDTLYWGFVNFTVGDFDLDGKTDIVTAQQEFGQIATNVHIFECFGDNDYRKVFMDSLSTPNNGADLFSGNDMDNNGKPEFLINSSGGGGGSWIMVLWLYETTGDNQYDYFCIDSIGPIPGRTEAYASLCVDIDSDGKEEIIWSVRNNWLVYKAVGIHRYQRIFNAYPLPGGSGVDCTILSAADLNGNGYPEVVESAYRNDIIPEHWTKIWEIEGVRLHQPNVGEVIQPGSQFPITWEKFTPPGADSFTLFISFNNGLNYQTIATIQQSNDTLFLWSVPDTVSDSCKIMIWAYGPPRPGEDKPRGTAWDFSDSVFAIRQTAVGEDTRYRILDTGLKILQNPTKRDIQFTIKNGKWETASIKIYNIAGKLVKNLICRPSKDGRYMVVALDAGVYFVRFETEGKAINRKVVVVGE